MIDYIKGTITEINPTSVTIETGNIGYSINISINTFSKLDGKTEIKIPQKEKNKKLQDICNEFSTIAFSYGFSTNDIINELQKNY